MTKKHNKRQPYTLVVGLGVTGASVVRHLTGLGERVVVADSRDIPPCLSMIQDAYPDLEIHTGGFDKSLFKRATRIVVSPGVSLQKKAILAAREEGVEIIGDLDLFFNVVTAPVIAITGSNGKSTVTTLFGEMMQAAGHRVAVGGNLGTPVLDLIDDVDAYVLELSSFQLDTAENLPLRASVVLNVSEDHMDRYPDLLSYAMSKQKIYEAAQDVVINLDDARANSVESGRYGRVVGFTVEEPEEGQFGLRDRDGILRLCRGSDELVRADDLKIRGRHNLANALAALALGEVLGLPMDVMVGVLRRFEGLPHRMQWIANIDGVDWINDSKATNVGACVAAIEGMTGRSVLIAGGIGKDADFSLLKVPAALHLKHVVLIGKDASKIDSALEGVVGVEYAQDMSDAVMRARAVAERGDSVLLSPACASFDMYRNFEHRGEEFMALVGGLES